MNYMMLIHHDDAALAEANQKELWADYAAFNRLRLRPAFAYATAKPRSLTAHMPTPRRSSPATSRSTLSAPTKP
jgi:hypothetical protein